MKEWSIEHIYPQNPKIGPKLPDAVLHELGNLCLLDPKVNSHLRNLDYIEKKAKVAELGRRPIPETIKIDDASARSVFEGTATTWGVDEIEERSKRLVDDAVEIFSINLSLMQKST